MTEEIIIFYPPGIIFLNIDQINKKKEIEISLYNKSNYNVLYKINSKYEKIFKIEKSLSVIKPLSSRIVKISFNNTAENYFNNKIYEINFKFYILNKISSNILDLNAILKEKTGNEVQEKLVNIYITNNKAKDENKQELLNKDLKYYIKFKNDLNEINNKLKKIIDSKINNNKPINKNKNNKLFLILILLVLIFVSGFIFGLILSKQYNKLFKKQKKINGGVKEENEEFVEVKFMTKQEADELSEFNYENKKYFENLNNFNILKEAKKNREKKQLIMEKMKKLEKEKKNSFVNILKGNIVLVIIVLIILI